MIWPIIQVIATWIPLIRNSLPSPSPTISGMWAVVILFAGSGRLGPGATLRATRKTAGRRRPGRVDCPSSQPGLNHAPERPKASSLPKNRHQKGLTLRCDPNCVSNEAETKFRLPSSSPAAQSAKLGNNAAGNRVATLPGCDGMVVCTGRSAARRTAGCPSGLLDEPREAKRTNKDLSEVSNKEQ